MVYSLFGHLSSSNDVALERTNNISLRETVRLNTEDAQFVHTLSNKRPPDTHSERVWALIS